MSTGDEKTPQEKLEEMLADFEKTHPKAGRNLRALLEETPAMKENFLSAIEKGNLEKIGTLSSKDIKNGVMGGYISETKTMELPESLLKHAGTDPKLANTLRMVVTHESEHAVNKQAIDKSNQAFEAELKKIAEGPSPHDYTDAIKAHLKERRLREATDQIGGFNAVAAQIHKENPGAKDNELYAKLFGASPQMEPYFEVAGETPNKTFKLKNGLELGIDGQIEKTPKNIEAMGKSFYDVRQTYAIGYPLADVYKAIEIEKQAQKDAASANPNYKPPEVRCNLHALGIGGLGVRLEAGMIDTSPPEAQRPYLLPSVSPNSQQQSPAPRASGPNPPTTQEAAPASRPNQSQGSPPPIDHAQYQTRPALYEQSRAAFETLKPAELSNDAQRLDTASWAMAVKAHDNRLPMVDQIVGNTRDDGYIAIGGANRETAPLMYLSKAEAGQMPPQEKIANLPAPTETNVARATTPPTIEQAQPEIAAPKPQR